MGSLPTVIIAILILAAPLGVAGQNIGLGLALLLFLGFFLSDKKRSLVSVMKSPVVAQFFQIWLVALLPIIVATLVKDQFKEAGRFFLGYVLVTPIFVMGLTLRDKISQTIIYSISTLILVLVALVSLSQFLFGWQISGLALTDQIKRSQGFYSHPLTLAYAALAIMPLVCARAFGKTADPRAVISALALLCVIITSQSITVITLTGITLAFLAVKLLSRKNMIYVTLFALAAGMVTIGTSNPIAHKFRIVLQGQRSDHETPYADDRLAFWHAHWEMFKEAPIIGHGADITRSDRKPYYEKIGLGHIKRMYEAHNMYLQAAVEGGLLAVTGLLTFFIWWFLRAMHFTSPERWQRLAAMMTPLVFAAGGLTQNAIQDSEVRYMIILSCTICFCLMTPGLSRKT